MSRPVTSLGQQWGEKFSERSPNFLNMSNSFKLYPTHFSRGEKKLSRGDLAPLRTPSYGPANEIHKVQS